MECHNRELKDRIADLISRLFKEKNDGDEFLIGILIDRLLWAATEYSNTNANVKYLGQPYWSKKAVLRYAQNKENPAIGNFNGLRHEHVVPRKVVKSYILGLSDKSSKNILKVLEQCSHAVVVTIDEDNELKRRGLNRAMPEGFDQKNPTSDVLARYRSTSIEIVAGPQI